MTKLQTWGLAAFESTNKGTIATIMDKRIYDINEEPERPTTGPSKGHQEANERPLTKNERRKEYPRSCLIFRQEDAGATLFGIFQQTIKIYPGDKRAAETEFQQLKLKLTKFNDNNMKNILTF